ncbi:MAG: hypothetical protein M3Y03_00535 [Verrucomicrobiota bacterium]|nr:hypothetical protein [Verrucomicrobiota bacterium]
MKLSTLVAAISFFTALTARAVLPVYLGFEIEARTDLTAAFNITNGYSISSFTPDINDAGQVTFRAQGPQTQSIWFGGHGAGGLVYTPPPDNFLADPAINAAGLTGFTFTIRAPGRPVSTPTVRSATPPGVPPRSTPRVTSAFAETSPAADNSSRRILR